VGALGEAVEPEAVELSRCLGAGAAFGQEEGEHRPPQPGPPKPLDEIAYRLLHLLQAALLPAQQVEQQPRVVDRARPRRDRP
jgi:hypothetical protein